MESAELLAKEVGVVAACESLGVARASYYRRRQRVEGRVSPPEPRPRPPLALSPEERQEVLDVLHSERFFDLSPRQVWAGLLDEEQRYLCSPRTMYRILSAEGELKERRNQLRRPVHEKPELLATAPNQVWSWDITKLKGPVKWSYFHLYVILDIFSRYVVGWMVADRESSTLAKRLISATIEKQGIYEDQLTLHADRGSSMKSKPVALMLADLGVTKTHNRPYTSNDNPYSESQFKTLKYHPSFPERFGSREDARAHCQSFFTWYNAGHYHTGLGLLTPESVHYGLASEVLEHRREVLHAAFERHPERFKHRQPTAPQPPCEVWINPPKNSEDEAPGAKLASADESGSGQLPTRFAAAETAPADEYGSTRPYRKGMAREPMHVGSRPVTDQDRAQHQL